MYLFLFFMPNPSQANPLLAMLLLFISLLLSPLIISARFWTAHRWLECSTLHKQNHKKCCHSFLDISKFVLEIQNLPLNYLFWFYSFILVVEYTEKLWNPGTPCHQGDKRVCGQLLYKRRKSWGFWTQCRFDQQKQNFRL